MKLYFNILLTIISFGYNLNFQTQSTGGLQQIARLGQGEIELIRWMPDAHTLMVGSAAGIWLHDLTSSSVTHAADGFAIDTANGSQTNIYATRQPDGVLQLWNGQENTTPTNLRNIAGREAITAFNHDATLFAYTSFYVRQLAIEPDEESTVVYVHNTATGAEIAALQHQTAVSIFEFNSNGTVLATKNVDGEMTFWNTESYIPLNIQLPTARHISRFKFSANDENVIVLIDQDNTIRLFNIATQQELITIQLENIGSAGANLTLSHDDTILAAMGSNYEIILFSAVDGHILSTTPSNLSTTSIEFSPDDTQIISSHFDGATRVWEVATGRNIFTFEPRLRPIFDARFNPDGTLIASASWGNTVDIYDAQTGALITTLDGYTSRVEALDFSSDGIHLVSCETGIVWDTNTGQQSFVLDSGESIFRDITFSPDSTLIASVNNYGTVQLWDAQTGAAITTLSPTADVTSVAFNSNGTMLASGHRDHTVRLWNLETYESSTTLIQNDTVNDVAFSPDDNLLAVATGGFPGDTDDFTFYNEVNLWNLETGERLTMQEGHSEYVYAVAFSPDGSIIASSGGDGTIRLWNMTTRQPIAVLDGQSQWIRAIDFSPNGYTLASAGDDGRVHLWDIRTQTELVTLECHTEIVLSLAFNDGGTLLASGGSDGIICLWATEAQ